MLTRTLPPRGDTMDRALPRSRWRRLAARVRGGWLVLGIACAGIGLAAATRWPQGATVAVPELATVRAGEFRDELALRARVEPLRSVQLDASESGRVEEVLAHDGDWVDAGTPLYRLHSPEQEQLLMQRAAEVAQQMANVSVQRSAQAASLAQNRRELAQLQAAQQQAEAELGRQAALAAAGFVSEAGLDETRRRHALAARLLEQAVEDQRIEARTRAQTLAEMARAVQGLQRGLALLEGARERLLQRAPIAGRLSGLAVQPGANVRPGDRLGRIDDPTGGMQLVAEIDEHHLARLRAGQAARVDAPAAGDGAAASGALSVAQVLPQVQAGKVRVQLRWAGVRAPRALQPGQTLPLKLQLEAPTPALVVADGPGVRDPLYVRDGHELRRRSVTLGRRAAGQVEILAGLRAGDEVLISSPPTGAAERLALP
jgi:HlyD family secretion protein